MSTRPFEGEIRIVTLRARHWHEAVRYYRECIGLKQRFADEATQYADPRIWTAERDQQMWQSLEG